MNTTLINQSVKLPLRHIEKTDINHSRHARPLVHLLALFLLTGACQLMASAPASGPELEQFKRAWSAARRGDHDSFNQIKDGLQGYL